MRKKIPTCSNSALVLYLKLYLFIDMIDFVSWAINVRFAKKVADSSQLILLLILLLGIFRQGIEERNQIYALFVVKVLVKKPI